MSDLIKILEKDIELVARTKSDVEVEAYVAAQRQRYANSGQSFDENMAKIEKNKMPLSERVRHEALTGDARASDIKALAQQHMATLKEEIAADKRTEIEGRITRADDAHRDAEVIALTKMAQKAQRIASDPAYRQSEILAETKKVAELIGPELPQAPVAPVINHVDLGDFRPSVPALTASTNRAGQRFP